MADAYGMNMGNVLAQAGAVRSMQMNRDQAAREAELHPLRQQAMQQGIAAQQQSMANSAATARMRQQMFQRDMSDEDARRRGRESMARGEDGAFENLFALDPGTAIQLRNAMWQADDRERDQIASTVKAETEAAGRLAAGVLSNPEIYSKVRNQLPPEVQQEWPESFDTPGQDGLTGEAWLQFELAQARELDDLVDDLKEARNSEAFNAALGQRESSGDYQAQNAEGYTGKYQYGQARLSDFKQAHGIDFTMEQFRNDPDLQEDVHRWATKDNLDFIFREGLNKRVGERLEDGTVLTLDGMLGGIHLGGKQGLKNYVESGGERNPADSNGTRIGDYVQQFGGTEGQSLSESDPRTDPRQVGLMQAMSQFEPDSAQYKLLQQVWDTGYLDTANQEPSAAEAKISRLMETGLSREEAIRTAERYEITPLGELVDKASGQIVGGAGSEAPPMEAAETTSIMPTGEGVDYQGATGTSGFISSLANTISELAGMGLVDPENERATQALTNLATRTEINLADAVAGRPSNYLLQKLEKLAVNPNSPMQGPGRARERLIQTRDMLDEAIRENMDVVQAGVSNTEKSKARANVMRLKRLRDDYNSVIESFGERNPRGGQPASSGTTQSGLGWSIE